MAKKAVTNPTPTTPRRFSPWRWFVGHFGKLLLVALVIVAGYSLYLDAQIKAKFDGNRWQVPAQIYARPLVLEVGSDLTLAELTDELQLLSYRKVANVRQTGEYSVVAGRVRFIRRAFDFPSGHEDAIAVEVSFNGDKVASLRDFSTQQTLSKTALEPWLITRLVSKQREDRMLVRLEDVPKSLTDTLLLVEDRDFYEHFGVAPLSILRALVANIKAGDSVQGGSTLTQQLVKNFFLTRDKNLLRKINEAWMSLLLELRYSKDEILEAYLNEIYLGQNGNSAVHGFGLASRYYFDRPLNELNQGEIALLVGLVKGPSYYNPRRYEERALERRDMILRLLLQENRITTAEYKSLSKQPIKLADMGRLRGDKHPAYMDKVRRELADSVPDMQTLDAGVRVFVAMDPLAQRRAESALTSQLSTLEKQRKLKDLQGAMLVTDIRSGELRVIVGDRDVDFEGFNRALDAKRQVGSEIKPAVYLTALEDPASYTLATPLDDKPIQLRSTHGNLWSPKNADKQYRGQVPLYEALVHSLNVPTVGLGMQVGLDNVADMLFRLGVDEPVEPYPAMTLGAVNFSPLMVNQMFQTIANEGLHIPLHALLAVTDNDNRLIWQRDLPAVQRIDAKAAYLMNYALHKVTTEGTAKQLGSAFPDVHLAGKTGTTDDYRDSWFSGFDRTSVATVWVGRDDNQSTGLTGASGAMQLYASYLHQQHPKSLLRSMPQGVTITAFDQHGDMLAVNCQANLRLPAIIDEQRQLQNCQPVKPATKKKSWWEKLFGGR